MEPPVRPGSEGKIITQQCGLVSGPTSTRPGTTKCFHVMEWCCSPLLPIHKRKHHPWDPCACPRPWMCCFHLLRAAPRTGACTTPRARTTPRTMGHRRAHGATRTQYFSPHVFSRAVSRGPARFTAGLGVQCASSVQLVSTGKTWAFRRKMSSEQPCTV